MRGKCLKKPNKSTQLFATNYQTKLRESGCLGDQNQLLIDKFEAAHESGLLDLKWLSFAISNKDAD